MLAAAYKNIEDAKNIDIKHPEIDSTLSSLEDVYIEELKAAIEAEDKDLIAAYSNDTDGKSWPSERIFQLKQLAQKKDKKPKRVITGGF